MKGEKILKLELNQDEADALNSLLIDWEEKSAQEPVTLKDNIMLKLRDELENYGVTE